MAGTDRGNTVKIKNYVKPASLEEAWELNQKRSARLIGGMMWASDRPPDHRHGGGPDRIGAE